ncbi:hypothetical protein [Pseudochelatococcus contaminans]|uniref:Uncharacterized protein n=1 Tax=Pseudochelatococcus contaminans TaxID=1538103 RepID=A0A7W5Z6C5_9HYPH|nr:hypothetical protein [Pseudochelatococcus contaminans]MBB3810512.1 hypothetical protein [Pseudochelatococcus contaminans]
MSRGGSQVGNAIFIKALAVHARWLGRHYEGDVRVNGEAQAQFTLIKAASRSANGRTAQPKKPMEIGKPYDSSTDKDTTASG